jgi:glycosyltransferase involved in cell wall biosynthesis
MALPEKKILICTDYPAPNETMTGGIPRSVYSTVQALKKIAPEYDFHIVTLSATIKRSTILKDDNLTVHYLSFPLKNMPILVPKFLSKIFLLRYIRRIQPDLVHAMGTGWDYAYPALSWDPDSVIITVHGVIRQESKHWTGFKGRYHAVTGQRMENKVLAHARNVIAVSPYVKREVQPFTQGDITVIFNPVDKIFFTVEKDEVLNQLLFVGGIEERKGLDVLIRAVARIKKTVPDIELHIVGGIRKIVYHHAVCNLIKSLDLEENIVFCGRLTDSLLFREYREAAVFVLPSYEESQGIVILEAMATGTPVVATRAGGIPDMILDGANGCLVECGDDKQMAVSIVSLLQDKERRRVLGESGKETALQYLPEIIAQQHLQVYNRLLSHVP